jgi:hypothetical protein
LTQKDKGLANETESLLYSLNEERVQARDLHNEVTALKTQAASANVERIHNLIGFYILFLYIFFDMSKMRSSEVPWSKLRRRLSKLDEADAGGEIGPQRLEYLPLFFEIFYGLFLFCFLFYLSKNNSN